MFNLCLLVFFLYNESLWWKWGRRRRNE